jgi:hypothetical protein
VLSVLVLCHSWAACPRLLQCSIDSSSSALPKQQQQQQRTTPQLLLHASSTFGMLGKL